LYVLDMTAAPTLRAWRPQVHGISEVLHAYFPDHAYPLHTHDTWALLVVDAGVVCYDLDRHQHGAAGRFVTLLPPHVPHDGRSATPHGFAKRVVYLDESALPVERVGAAVDRPAWADPTLFDEVDRLHGSLLRRGDVFESEERLVSVCERLRRHLVGLDPDEDAPSDAPVARRLRALIDDHLVSGLSLRHAATTLQVTQTHLARAFSKEYGIPPHRYLTGRRLDRARRLLLAGQSAAAVASSVGFYDQAHFHRHFHRLLGVSPSAYAMSAA